MFRQIVAERRGSVSHPTILPARAPRVKHPRGRCLDSRLLFRLPPPRSGGVTRWNEPRTSPPSGLRPGLVVSRETLPRHDARSLHAPTRRTGSAPDAGGVVLIDSRTSRAGAGAADRAARPGRSGRSGRAARGSRRPPIEPCESGWRRPSSRSIQPTPSAQVAERGRKPPPRAIAGPRHATREGHTLRAARHAHLDRAPPGSRGAREGEPTLDNRPPGLAAPNTLGSRANRTSTAGEPRRRPRSDHIDATTGGPVHSIAARVTPGPEAAGSCMACGERELGRHLDCCGQIRPPETSWMSAGGRVAWSVSPGLVRETGRSRGGPPVMRDLPRHHHGRSWHLQVGGPPPRRFPATPGRSRPYRAMTSTARSGDANPPVLSGAREPGEGLRPAIT